MPGTGHKNGTWRTQECLQCKKLFIASPITSFCSRACYDKHNENGVRIAKTCAQCSKEFQVIKSLESSRFCSRNCWYAYRQANRRRYTCQFCNKEFFASNLHRVTCSNKCAGLLASQKEIETSGRVSIKTARDYLRRIKNECWECGYNQEPRILQIHHKNRKPSDNRKENIILLCPNCHELDHVKAKDGRYLGAIPGSKRSVEATLKTATSRRENTKLRIAHTTY